MSQKSSAKCVTLEQHKDLLSEQGYFSDNFKTAWHLGMWQKEIEEQLNLCKKKSSDEKNKQRFTIDTRGKFNHDFDTVLFSFSYEFDPFKDTLTFLHLKARFKSVKKLYLKNIPEASKVYQTLSMRKKVAGNEKLFERIADEQRRKLEYDINGPQDISPSEFYDSRSNHYDGPGNDRLSVDHQKYPKSNEYQKKRFKN